MKSRKQTIIDTEKSLEQSGIVGYVIIEGHTWWGPWSDVETARARRGQNDADGGKIQGALRAINIDMSYHCLKCGCDCAGECSASWQVRQYC